MTGNHGRGRDSRSAFAAEAASELGDEAPRLVDSASGVEWYERPGSDVDYAGYVLCRLRRARAGAKGGHLHGDEAVRAALVQADRDALVWFASRAVSYMDETGFPEAVERWFVGPDEEL
ncbi:MAG TPA: hypothetical protein VFR38_11940 [Gaiellaceae bacterium]|nr:hypothetical protein [Gaiellaceae bacterium]